MGNIKLGDLYLSKSELDDRVQLVAKKRHIKIIKTNRTIVYIKSLRNNQKIKKE